MKLLIKILVVAGLLMVWSVPAAGIDKSKKDEKPADEKTITIEKKEQDQSQKKADPKDAENQQSKKNYDNFIDRNNNGIDDRSEKNVSKQPPKKDTKENPEPKKPTP